MGTYSIYYMKSEFFRYGLMGYDRLKCDNLLPDPDDLTKTHVFLKLIEARNLEHVYFRMQGEDWCPTGEARITKGYRLPAKHVIHTVGPVWHGGASREDDLLASCYRNSFALLEQHGPRSIAFPAISCGVYAFPIDRAAAIAVREMKAFLERNTEVERVLVVCFGADVYEAYCAVLQELVPE